jgi:hypothetical protein
MHLTAVCLGICTCIRTHSYEPAQVGDNEGVNSIAEALYRCINPFSPNTVEARATRVFAAANEAKEPISEEAGH